MGGLTSLAPAGQQPAQIGQLGQQMVPLGQHGHRPGIDQLPGHGRSRPGAQTLQERLAELLLQLRNGLADRGLGGEKRPGRLGKTAKPHHCHKGLEIAQFHAHSNTE